MSKNADKPWLITYCIPSNLDEHEDTVEEINYELNCLDDLVQRKLAIMLHGLVRVGHINCNKVEAREKLCPVLKPKLSAPIVYYNYLPKLEANLNINSVDINTNDYKKIAQLILSFLPDVKQLDDAEFKVKKN